MTEAQREGVGRRLGHDLDHGRAAAQDQDTHGRRTYPAIDTGPRGIARSMHGPGRLSPAAGPLPCGSAGYPTRDGRVAAITIYATSVTTQRTATLHDLRVTSSTSQIYSDQSIPDPPEGQHQQARGQTEEDRRLDALEEPEPTGGLVDERLQNAVVAQAHAIEPSAMCRSA